MRYSYSIYAFREEHLCSMCWWSKAGGGNKGQRGRKRHQNAKTVSSVRRKCTKITARPARLKLFDGAKWRILVGNRHRIRDFFSISSSLWHQHRHYNANPFCISSYRKTATNTHHDTAANFHLESNNVLRFPDGSQSTHLWASGQSHAAIMNAALQATAL